MYTCTIICTYITYTCIVHISTYIQSLLINIYTLLVLTRLVKLIITVGYQPFPFVKCMYIHLWVSQLVCIHACMCACVHALN